MLLQQLPPEIILLILRMLGSVFFRENTRRLLVSKWWYYLARIVLLQDLVFSTASLQKFVLTFKGEDSVKSIQTHPVTASFFFEGFTDWDSLSSNTSDPVESATNRAAVIAWTDKLNDRLAQLAVTLQRCTKLQSLILQAHPENEDLRAGFVRRNYLMAPPLVSLVSINNLTCLEIDTAGTGLINQNHGPITHFCHHINSKLSTLRRLRCRLTCLCPDILDPHPETDSLPHLKDVIINLSLSELTDSDTSYRYPSSCNAATGGGFLHLKEGMEAKAKSLVSKMHNPRIVRIVSHTFPGLQMHSFDAIAERRMKLASAMPWDADGEEVEETLTGQEEFDSDFSSEEGSPW